MLQKGNGYGGLGGRVGICNNKGRVQYCFECVVPLASDSCVEIPDLSILAFGAEA